MFSYRHAFHAGNHADVLKHVTLIATLHHLMKKDAGLTLVDTHAGAGLYRLDSDHSRTGAEAEDGITRLMSALRPAGQEPVTAPQAVEDYLDLVASFNPDGRLRVYPGSPFVIHRMMRPASRDRLKLFELHPTDSRALSGHVAQLGAGRQVAVLRQDGFEGLRPLLPPPPSAAGSRRALVLIDPSYELKTDYARVVACIEDGLRRFPTGTYLVWYPVIPRPQAHELPRRLRSVANRSGKPWLHATLSVGQAADTASEAGHTGLRASGMFVINPPHTLKPALQAALPVLLQHLGRGRGQGQALEAGGSS